MGIIRIQTGKAARAFGDALAKTVPTASATVWLISYAAEWGFSDWMRFASQIQPIRPLMDLVVGL